MSNPKSSLIINFPYQVLGLSLSLLLGSLVPVQAQKYSNEFLSLGVGAAAMGQGNAVVAGVDDVMAGYWNPAALGKMDLENGLQVGAQHAEWFAGISKYDYLGLALPLKGNKSTIGLSVIRFATDDIPNTLQLFEDDGSINYDNITPFSTADYAFLGSYSRQLFTHRGKLFLGGNVKVIHRTVGNFAKAWGFGLDAAINYEGKHWSFGAVLRDATSTFNSWTFNFSQADKTVLQVTGNIVPESSLEVTKPQLVAGAAWHKRWGKLGFQTELDAVITLDEERNTLVSSNPYSLSPAVGAVLDYGEFIFLRAGVNNFQEVTDDNDDLYWTYQPSFGVGLKVFNMHIDYAFSNLGGLEDVNYTHMASLVFNVRFGYLKQAVKNSSR